MKSLSKIIALVISTLLLQSCANGINKQAQGNIFGGLAGGLLGSQFGKGRGQLAATGLGVLGGALIGGMVGSDMDARDRQMAADAQRNALEVTRDNQSISWRNPNTCNSGSITPVRTYEREGQYCREFRQTVIINGKRQTAYGTACRCPDGSWRIMP